MLHEQYQYYTYYLFDLDGTLMSTISGERFPQTVNDRELLPNRWETLFVLHQVGKKTAICTNQGGAAWGLIEQDEMNMYLAELKGHLSIDLALVCYHDTSENARAKAKHQLLTLPDYYGQWERRKPAPGMLFEAMDSFKIDNIDDVIMVGDREEDRLAADHAGITFAYAWDFFNDGPMIV